jgi:hypothetical protein
VRKIESLLAQIHAAFCGANFSLQRRLQPTFGRFFIRAGHWLKPMLQAEARATSHANFRNQALVLSCGSTLVY